MKNLKLASATILFFILTGCTAAVVGGGAAGGIATYRYISGKLEVVYSQPYEIVWQATEKAVKSLKFIVSASHHDALEGEIRCQSATGKNINIRVKKEGDKVTKVYIKVGLFGNLDFSLQIKQEIDKFLKNAK